MQDIQTALKTIFTNLGLNPALATIVPSNRPDLCDYQCNGALAAAKVLKKAPPVIAQEIVNQLQDFTDYTFSVASGYINIKLNDTALLKNANENLSVTLSAGKVLIDYGSPNVAKGMHVGHLRSTLIGSALVNIHKFSGKEVIGDNHIGDWGTPLGIVISKIQKTPNFIWSLENIEQLYVEGSKEYKTDEGFKLEVLQTTNNLQQGNSEIKRIWQQVVDTTISALKDDYQKMNISFDLWEGESSFEHILPVMIKELTDKGVVSESNGAKVIELENEQPLLLEKSGGGYLYHTTDLACLKVRSPLYDKILYVVDKRQNLHFKQVFMAAEKVGYLKDVNQVEHVAFGTINGADGKPYKTRDGEVLKLKELIALVYETADSKIKSNFTAEEKEHNLPIIAIGALKFAELKHNRLSDYVFDLDKFMSLEGFTGPYVMYSAVRAKSLLNKAILSPIMGSAISSSSERELILLLGKFKEVFENCVNNNEPHHLCEYTFKIANTFNSFYHDNPILKEKDIAKQSHYLWLTQKVLDTLSTSLALLGINVPEKM